MVSYRTNFVLQQKKFDKVQYGTNCIWNKIWFTQCQNGSKWNQTEYNMTEVFCNQHFATSCLPVRDIAQRLEHLPLTQQVSSPNSGDRFYFVQDGNYLTVI